MHVLRFFVDSSGWPMMQYKVFPIYPIWSPANAPLIRMWKVNPDGSPNLFMNVPSLVLYCPIWSIDSLKFVGRQKLVSVGLSKICGFLEGGHCTKCNL